MNVIKWNAGDIAVDPIGREWTVLAVNDGNILEYPELDCELLESVELLSSRILISSRLLKKKASA